VIDVTQFIGQTLAVTAADRTMTVTVGDGGPLKWWDHRQVLSLTVAFTDGRRSHWASADAAAAQVAEKIFAPYTVGMLGGGGNWEPLIERSQRDKGKRRNGSTMFTFFVFQGTMPLISEAEEQAMDAANMPLQDRLARITAAYRERAGISEVERRYAAACTEFGIAPVA
jgi:hypothetical protein